MISFKTISSFRSRLSGLLSVRRKVYANVENEIKREFAGKPIEQIRQNNDMVLLEGDLIIIKLRLPDKKQQILSKLWAFGSKVIADYHQYFILSQAALSLSLQQGGPIPHNHLDETSDGPSTL